MIMGDKMKKKIFAIFLCFSVIFCVGIGVAYYNTKSFGFEDDVKIVERDDEKIKILDFNIYYDDIDSAFNKARKFVPEEQLVCLYNVYHI